MPFGSLCHKKNDTIQNIVSYPEGSYNSVLSFFFFSFFIRMFCDLSGACHQDVKWQKSGGSNT